MRQEAITEGFWIFQDSEYGWFLRMQALHKVLIMAEYGSIMPFGKVLNMPGNVSQGSKYAKAQNMARLWICEGYTECWICQSKS